MHCWSTKNLPGTLCGHLSALFAMVDERQRNQLLALSSGHHPSELTTRFPQNLAAISPSRLVFDHRPATLPGNAFGSAVHAGRLSSRKNFSPHLVDFGHYCRVCFATAGGVHLGAEWRKDRGIVR